MPTDVRRITRAGWFATVVVQAAISFAPVHLATLASAQEGPTFKLTEQVINAGGHPLQGTILTSASFQVTQDALGEAVSGIAMQSDSFTIEPGFVPPYLPPGAVAGLRFQADTRTVFWQPEASAVEYNLYRGLVTAFSPQYGACQQPAIAGESGIDSELPAQGAGFFYLVTARNRIGEEGTKGVDSAGSERANATPCP